MRDNMAIKDKLNNEDFIIQVKPTLKNDSEWTGEVDVSVITSSDNPLNDEDYYGVLEFCRVMCASIPLMERDENIRKKAIAFLQQEDREYEKQNKAKIVDRHDNVVVLSFDSDTKH